MTSVPVFAQIITQAVLPGDEEPPAKLLERIRAHQNPLAVLSDGAETESWSHAVLEQFGYMYSQAWPHVPSPAQVARWSALLRWTLRELREWHNEADPARHQLVAILRVTQYLSAGESLWPAMPSGLDQNEELITALARFVSGMGATICTPPGAPIHEEEAATRLQSLDAGSDWAALRHLLPKFLTLFLTTGFVVPQTVLSLHRYASARLSQAVANVGSTIAALQMASCLPITARLQLAIDCGNPRIRFAVMYVTLVAERNTGLLPADKKLLTHLLLDVAMDEPVWTAWMTAFNQPPIGALQESLGQALATAPDNAVHAYVDSVMLSISTHQRHGLVAQCLRAFSSAAPLPRRQLLWTAAHRRWVAWDFDAATPDRHLTELAFSELDYAIIGYSIECQTTEERDQAIQSIVQDLNASEYLWHASLSDVVTMRNRLLSRFQPYVHAISVIVQPKEWIFQGHYPLTDTRGDEYMRLMFRAR